MEGPDIKKLGGFETVIKARREVELSLGDLSELK